LSKFVGWIYLIITDLKSMKYNDRSAIDIAEESFM
jgi:hypothetical protein